MPVEVDRGSVQNLLEQGAQLVEVLSSDAYQKIHLAGAINIPLKEMDRESTAGLDRQQPVIVYCYDYQ